MFQSSSASRTILKVTFAFAMRLYAGFSLEREGSRNPPPIPAGRLYDDCSALAATDRRTDRVHNVPRVRRAIEHETMTGDQSRGLKVGDRVCWGVTTADLGTVAGTSWSGVTIDWDDGHTTSIQHNDMAQVERVPVRV
jgi:hypothetical protein